MRAALYARYSSDNQRYESITAQLRCSKEYCAQKHYDVVKIYNQWHFCRRSHWLPADDT